MLPCRIHRRRTLTDASDYSPGAADRGGVPEDGENLTKLLKELKSAMGARYLLTFTVPTSYWYLRHFDIKKSAEAADWINLMSYDLHVYVIWQLNATSETKIRVVCGIETTQLAIRYLVTPI